MEGLLGLGRRKPNTVLRSAAVGQERRKLVQDIVGEGDERDTAGGEGDEGAGGIEVRAEHANVPVLAASVGPTAVGLKCAICRKVVSVYNCPQCNIPYCSLTCFRAPKHSTCAESFQRQTLRNELGHSNDNDAAAKADEEERRKMMDVLRRMQSLGETPEAEDNAEEERKVERAEQEWEDESEGDEEHQEGDKANDWEQRAERAGLDLEEATMEELLALLSKEERTEFEALIAKSQGAGHGSEKNDLLSGIQDEQPWWSAESKASPRASQRFEASVKTLTGSMQTNTKAFALRWNIVAVVVAYAYILRHFGTSSLQTLAKRNDETSKSTCRSAVQTLGALVPFLLVTSDSDGKLSEGSRQALESAESVTLWIVAKLGSDVGKHAAQTMLFLFTEALVILRKPKVAIEGEADLRSNMHLALCDVESILPKYAQRKVAFYAAAWGAMGLYANEQYQFTIRALEDEITRLQDEVKRSEDEERWRAAFEAVEKHKGIISPS